MNQGMGVGKIVGGGGGGGGGGRRVVGSTFHFKLCTA